MKQGGASQEEASAINLTVLIRTLNEEDRIRNAIASALPLGAEILVIDAGSTDRTVEIAEGLGARVISNPWPGFGPQRRFGEERCRFDHVFSMDADEILTREIVSEIRDLFRNKFVPSLIRVRKVMLLPYHVRPTPWAFATEQVYIYDRRVARTSNNPNWDQLEINTSAIPYRLRSVAWHYTFRDWHHAVAKANYTSTLAANTSEPKSPVEINVRLLTEMPLSFLKFYFGRRLFLAGLDGVAMASVLAFGRFLRIAKMRERRRKEALQGLGSNAQPK
ncbi:glycosyltransferase family 2 protein [Micromonospora sp. STR1s_5]|nr:glycosyltransferase family 2 protein [Micromonospora sp. STR1s_5]